MTFSLICTGRQGFTHKCVNQDSVKSGLWRFFHMPQRHSSFAHSTSLSLKLRYIQSSEKSTHTDVLQAHHHRCMLQIRQDNFLHQPSQLWLEMHIYNASWHHAAAHATGSGTAMTDLLPFAGSLIGQHHCSTYHFIDRALPSTPCSLHGLRLMLCASHIQAPPGWAPIASTPLLRGQT